MKELYDVEDVNNDKLLQREEFHRFWQQYKQATVPEARHEAELSQRKTTAAWDAMRTISDDKFSVSWGDFMTSMQILNSWCSS